MAESLEEPNDVDCDKLLDAQNYKKHEFDIFIHDFRETAIPRAGCSIESDTPFDAALSRQVTDMERRLKKAKFTLQTLKRSKLIEEMNEKIAVYLDSFKNARKFLREHGEEFNLNNVPFADYNSTDMALLFGDDCESCSADDSGDESKMLTAWDGVDQLEQSESSLSRLSTKFRKHLLYQIRDAQYFLKDYDMYVETIKYN